MADRRGLLKRLERLRAIERQSALAQLAAKRAEQARMEEVTRRSRALAGDTIGVNGHDGASLVAALAFRARLAGLVSDAERLGAQASSAEALARTGFAEADRRLERVRERHIGAVRDADNRQLAQSLLNNPHKPRGLF